MLLTILANLLFLVGVAYCLINFCIVLHNLLRGTHASMVPLMGTLFMLGACLLLPVHVPPFAVLIFLLFDLSALPMLLALPFYLLRRALRGADAPPLLPNGLWVIIISAYLLLTGCPLLCCWLQFFIAGGESIPYQG